MPAEQTPQSPAVVRNGLSVLGVIPPPAETYNVPISPLPPPASPVRSVGIVYPFEPPSTPADWEPHPSIVLVPGGGEGSSRPSAGSPSTVNSTPGKRPCVGAKYTQQRLWEAPPPRKEASPQRPVATQDEAPAKTTGDVLYETIKHRFETEWKGRMHRSRCSSRSAGSWQRKAFQTFRTVADMAPTTLSKRKYGFRENLQAISTYLQELQRSHLLESPWIGLSLDESTDRIHGKHLIVYATFFRGTGVVNEFITLITVDRADAASLTSAVVQYLIGIGLDLQKISAISTDGASVMTRKNNGVVARLRMRIPHLASTHCVVHREALAASDAADAVPELYMVDDVIRGFADLISRSNVKYERFHNIQHVFCKTNLKAQGIHTVRWLSRGEAVRRFLEILPAAIVVLKEYNNDLYEIATSFKFQWLLRLLADKGVSLTLSAVLSEQIDVTLVSHLVDQTRMRMKNRYFNFSPDHHFGSGEKMTLNDFIQHHQKMDKQEVKAEGVDSDNNPVKFSYTLHENPIEGQETDGDVTACSELSLKFVRAVDKELEWWMKDLEELEGCKLFRSASYVPDDAKRVENFKKWLAKLHKLYRKKLPGFDYTRAQSELWMFTSTMYSQQNNEDFHQALGNMLRDNDWHHSFLNLMKMWQAVAVLSLSTVEFERGFSKQNLIKTWDRGSISDITLEHLMRCSLLQYDVDWYEVVSIFRGERLRRSTKDFSGTNPGEAIFAEAVVESSGPVGE
ncbi:unnamed protein product [Closterium sp. NIES-53]